MAGGTQIPVEVGQAQGQVVIKPTGICSMTICSDLQRFIRGLQRPQVTDVYFDLSAADGIDSTFTGLLLAMATKKGNANGPTAHLVRPSRPTVEALERMHVFKLFDVCDTVPVAPTSWCDLPRGAPAVNRVRELVVDCHQNLIDADARNAPVFQPVVDCFRGKP